MNQYVPPEDFGVNLMGSTPDDDLYRKRTMDICRAVDVTQIGIVLDDMVRTGHISYHQAEIFHLQASCLRAAMCTENSRSFVGSRAQTTSRCLRRFGVDKQNDWRRASTSPPPRDGSHIEVARGPYTYYRRFAQDPPTVVHWWSDPPGVEPTGTPDFYLSHGDDGNPVLFDWWRPLGLEPRDDPRDWPVELPASTSGDLTKGK